MAEFRNSMGSINYFIFHSLIPFIYVVCVEGTFGLGCSQRCQCSDGVTCDPVTGSCICPMGKMGAKCDKGNIPPAVLFSESLGAC